MGTRRVVDRITRQLSPLLPALKEDRDAETVTWQQPYALGLLSMLITLVAESHGAFTPEALADIQARTWVNLTGCSEHVFGQQVVELSSAGNPDFMSGCAAAESFFARMKPELFRPPETDFTADTFPAHEPAESWFTASAWPFKL